MDDLEKRRDQRARFLRRVYDVTDAGHPLKGAVVREIGAEMGLEPGESDAVTYHLVGQKLIRWNTLAGDVVMMPDGVAEAERLKEVEKQQTVARIPAPVIAEVARAFDSEYTHAQL